MDYVIELVLRDFNAQPFLLASKTFDLELIQKKCIVPVFFFFVVVFSPLSKSTSTLSICPSWGQ